MRTKRGMKRVGTGCKDNVFSSGSEAVRVKSNDTFSKLYRHNFKFIQRLYSLVDFPN